MDGKAGFWKRAFYLYYDGFRQMTIGRTLWLIIAIKLFVIFVVLKLFFFPNFLKQNAGKGNEADYVADELTRRIDAVLAPSPAAVSDTNPAPITP